MLKIKKLSNLVFRPIEMTFSEKVAFYRQKNRPTITQAILRLSDDYSLSVIKYEDYDEYCFGVFNTKKNKPTIFEELKQFNPSSDYCFYGNKDYTNKVICKIQELIYYGAKDY